ncbi:uncharacterized protein LOC135150297 [Daucus carota subsp. sativus]|uniref:uncharacterized protein LOC135150297 n=1 Tax=Daucus carota subsp. sativus TaxID=79200 RepID=UPI0030827417
MIDAEKNHYINSLVAPVPRACTKLMTQLDNKNKFAAVPLVTTPHMLQMFNTPQQPYQLQVAPPPQQPQQPQPLQIQQPQQQLSPQQSQEEQSPLQSSNQSSHHSPLHQQQPDLSFEDETLEYDFFENQPSSSEPLPPQTHPQIIPQTQSTSQHLHSDSPVNQELQSFHQDLQVAQVLSNFSSNFNVDTSDYVCNLDFAYQHASNEPDNTHVHNQADDSFQPTLDSPNTSTNTSMQPVRKVARKRSGSRLLGQPAALSPSKKQRVEAVETTAASSLPSQQGFDFEQAIKLSSTHASARSNRFTGYYVY